MKKIKLVASLSTLAIAATSIPIVATSCSCSKNKYPDHYINIIPNKDAVITGGESVEQPIHLGSFMLFDENEKLVKTDETSNLKLSFTGKNYSGFTNKNIKFEYESSSNTYAVTLKSGTANNKTCEGDISVTWTVDGQEYKSDSNLTINVTKKNDKKLAKGIYGPDFNPVTGEEPTIPVIKESGIYLDITDSTTAARVNAKWVVLGGGAYVDLINDADITSMNGLKVNLLPTTTPAEITVKAIPEDTSYEEAVFTFKIKQAEGAEVAIITANKGSSDGHPVLQYQSTQTVVDDIFTFKLNGADGEITTGVTWSVIGAKSGSPNDVVFWDGEDANKLQVITIHSTAAEYTIQASYGSGSKVNFVLKLFAGATVTATYKENATAESTTIEANTEIQYDFAIGNIITVTVDNFEDEIDYWKAEYEDATGIHSIPGFTSPSTNKASAVWTINDLDIENIPASSYITFKAYKSNSEQPLATFMFQAKVHMLSNIEGWSPWISESNKWVRFPWYFSSPSQSSTTVIKLAKSGNVEAGSESGARGMIDGVKTYVGVTAAFISDPIHDYYTITDDGTSMQINLTLSAIGKSFQVPVKFTVNVPDGNGLKILVYSTADFLKVVA